MKDFDAFWDEYENKPKEDHYEMLKRVLESLDIEIKEDGKFVLDINSTPYFCVLYSKAITKDILQDYHNWLKEQL